MHAYIHNSTVQYSTVQYSTVQYSTVQYSTVQYSTVQYSTVQYSTVYYITLHYITLHYIHTYHTYHTYDTYHTYIFIHIITLISLIIIIHLESSRYVCWYWQKHAETNCLVRCFLLLMGLGSMACRNITKYIVNITIIPTYIAWAYHGISLHALCILDSRQIVHPSSIADETDSKGIPREVERRAEGSSTLQNTPSNVWISIPYAIIQASEPQVQSRSS